MDHRKRITLSIVVACILAACGQEQAEVMRRFGLSGQAGGMAALLQTAGTLQ